jgi:hypothetical protein
MSETGQHGDWGDDAHRQHDLQNPPVPARISNAVTVQSLQTFVGSTILGASVCRSSPLSLNDRPVSKKTDRANFYRRQFANHSIVLRQVMSSLADRQCRPEWPGSIRGQPMIVETVLINLPKGADRSQVIALYEKTAAHWAANPDLVEKYYYYDPATGEGGGVYIWPDRAAAEKWHGTDYRRMIADVYGSEPRIRIFDAMMHVGASGIKHL